MLVSTLLPDITTRYYVNYMKGLEKRERGETERRGGPMESHSRQETTLYRRINEGLKREERKA